MKGKILKISSFLLGIALCLCLPLSFKQTKIDAVSAAVVESSMENYYLIDDATDGTVKTLETALGYTTGYGTFVLNAENVVLTAKAYDGYKIVGWHITYTERAGNSTEYIDESKNLQPEDGDPVGVEVTDLGTTESTFKLTRVFEDMVVVPVFDYVYYKLDITDLKEEILLPNIADKITISIPYVGDIYAYFQSKTDNTPSTGITEYNGVIVVLGTNYYYAGTVYGNGTDYYIIRDGKNISIINNLGTFRKGEIVEATFGIDTDSKKFDLTRVSNNESYLALSSGTMAVNQFSTTRNEQQKFTTEFAVNLEILHNSSGTNELKIEYDNLYKLTLEVKVDNAESYTVTKFTKNSNTLYKYGNEFYTISGNNRIPASEPSDIATYTSEDVLVNYTDMLKVASREHNTPAEVASSMIAVSGAFSQISRSEYYVKETSNFVVVSGESYTEQVNGTTYTYYNREGSDTIQYCETKENKDIVINYNHAKVKVHYEVGVYDEETFTKNQNLATIASSDAAIGSTTNLVNPTTIHTGYYFAGYKLKGETGAPTTTSVTIKNIAPVDVTVQACYSPTVYTIKLTGVNSIKLNNGVEEIGPISSLKFNGADASKVYEFTEIALSEATILDGLTPTTKKIDGTEYDIYSNVVDGANTYAVLYKNAEGKCFVKTFLNEKNIGTAKIGNSVNVTISINDGFKVTLPADFIINVDVLSGTTTLEGITITEAADAKTGVIELAITEEYITYTYTYKINATLDSETSTNVIMATISAEVNGVPAGILEEIKDGDDNVISNQITLSLHLYDVVKLSAVNKNATDYHFRYFNVGASEVTASDGGENEKYIEQEVSSNKTILVYYSMAETKFDIVLKEGCEENCVNWDAIGVLVNDGSANGDNTNGYVISQGNSVVINLNTAIKLGYYLAGVTLTNDGSNSTITYNADNNQIMFTALGGLQRVYLNVQQVTYIVNINFGSDSINKNNLEVKVLYDEDGNGTANLEFIKEEGKYVSSLKDENDNELSDCAETSEFDADLTYSTNIFIVLGDLASGKEIENGEVEISLTGVYSTYKLTVVIQLDDKFIGKIKYPIFNINGVDDQKSKDENVSSLGVDYGAKLKFSRKVNDIPVGYNLIGFKYSTGSEYVIGSEFIVKNHVTINMNVEYITYTIKLNYNTDLGATFTPSVTTTVANLNSSFQLSDNAPVGYYCAGAYKAWYEEVSDITADNFEENKGKLYVIANNYYELAESYTAGTTYYERVLGGTVETGADVSLDFSAQQEIKVGDNNFVEYYFEYAFKEIKIKNNSRGDKLILQQQDTGKGLEEISIDFKDYATYTISAIETKSGTTTDVDNITDDTLFNVLHTVTIYVDINDNYIYNGKIDGIENPEFNLVAGLYLPSKINIYAEYNIVSVEDGSGKYYITFKIIDLVDQVSEDEDGNFVLNIDWVYKAKDVEVTTNMNIGAQKFHEKAGFTVEEEYYSYDGEGSLESYLFDNYIVISNMGYLAKSRIVYSLDKAENGTGYTNNFKIDAFTINIGTESLTIFEKDYEQNVNGIKDKLISLGVYPTWEELKITVNDRLYTHRILGAIDVRYIENLSITLNVVPILYFNGVAADAVMNPFEKVLKANIERDQDDKIIITTSVPDFVKGSSIDYETDITIVDGVFNVSVAGYENVAGEYDLTITVTSEGDYDWANNMILPYKVKMIVLPASVSVICNAEDVKKLELNKPYDGTSDFVGDMASVINCLKIKINNEEIPYVDILKSDKGYDLKLVSSNNLSFQITTTTSQGEDYATLASNMPYNLQISELALASRETNNNFKLVGKTIIIKNVYTINKREIYLDISKVKINDKVYDGTDLATFSADSADNFGLVDVVYGDGTGLDTSKIKLTFDLASVGNNRTVKIDASNALIGDLASNYTIKEALSDGHKIYPYSIKVEIPEFGMLSIYNKRGLENPELANLIPINSFLEVEVVYADSGEYVEMYSKMESYISRTNVFVVAYKFNLIADGEKRPLDKNLYIGIPNVDKLTKILSYSEEGVDTIAYTIEDGEIILDLLSVPVGFDSIVITKHQPLLKLWQILLISIGGVTIIGATVTTFVVVRIKRKRKAEENEII